MAKFRRQDRGSDDVDGKIGAYHFVEFGQRHMSAAVSCPHTIDSQKKNFNLIPSLAP